MAFIGDLGMSSSSTRPCPRCGRPADKRIGEHMPENSHSAHAGLHMLAHGHPVGLVLAAGVAAVRAVLPKGYQCGNCGHRFGG